MATAVNTLIIESMFNEFVPFKVNKIKIIAISIRPSFQPNDFISSGCNGDGAFLETLLKCLRPSTVY